MFYLTKEGNVLFHDILNTFYLRLYGIRHMLKYHTDSEIGNLLPPHGLFFLINNKGYFICTIPQTGLHIPQPLLHQLFNDVLNTFYLWLYGVGLIIKDNSDSEKGNLLLHHELLFLLATTDFFLMHHPTDRIAHTMAFIIPVVEHLLE